MSTLSPIELSFWYQYKFEPLSDANNIIHKLVFAKHISFLTVQNTFSLLSKKHPALRTNFITVDGVPYRITQAELEPLVEDCTGMQSSSLKALARRTFKLESDAPIRVIYQSEHSKQTTLYITSPHIVFDANSWKILETDIVQLLQGQNDIKSYDLIYPNVDPSDNSYWQSRLNDIEGRITFEGSDDSQSGTCTLGVIDQELPELFNLVEQYAQTANISMNAFCIATVASVLSRLNDSKRIIISTPVTTRDASHQNMIGSFINVMPLPIQIIQKRTFTDFAQNVANEIWVGIEHRNFSHFELMPSQVKKHVDSQGVYNVMVEHFAESAIPNQIVSRELVDNTFPKMDLILSFIISSGVYRCRVEYDTTKLSKHYVLNLLRAIIETCNVVLNNSHVLMNQIPLVNEAEKAELALIGSGAHKKISHPYVWPRFEQMAERYSNSTAITYGTSHISYKDLYSKAMLYRAKLKTTGVAQNDAVGVYLPRSVDYVASMLAIWSLGAIYVPLDKNQPLERLSSMIIQSGIKLVISDLEISFKDYTGRILLINDIELEAEAGTYEKIKQSPSDTSYIIFTSGSTGQPKGVMIEHVGFMNHLEIMISELRLSPSDVIAQSAPVSFDISVWQLICPLIIGASLTIIDRSYLVDAEKVYKLINKQSISVLELVPSLLSAYLEAEGLIPDLRHGLSNTKIITTGETISRFVALQWCNYYPHKILLNAYGPAEASDDTHFFSITAESIANLESIPIGRSLLNIKTAIVNSDIQLLPKGFIGEICIGGIAVSKGYVFQPELTKAAFVESDISGEKQKWYRTGDFGRWNDNNVLEYHGRKDQQVKVLGQRLEIGEVESKISHIDSVKDVAVVAVNQSSGTKLVGFVVPSDHKVSLESIKSALAQKLPAYMVPWKLTLVEVLPRNINGKLDRKALETTFLNAEEIIEERVPTDAKLQAIISTYSDTLGVTINAYSNYFESGGDSIASMKIVSKLEHDGISVGVKDILLYQTPFELYTYLISNQREKIQQSKNWPRLDQNTPIQKAYLHKSTKEYVENGEIQAALLNLGEDILLKSDEILSGLNQIMSAHYELKPDKSSAVYVAPSKRISASLGLDTLVSELRQHISFKQPIVGCVIDKDARRYLLLIAHHYVIDFYSWPILRNELIDYIQYRTIPSQDDMLQKWWGNASQNFNPTEQIREYWLSQSAQMNITTHETTSSETELILDIGQDVINKLQDNAVSIESFARYLLTDAYFKLEELNSFSYQIESSIRVSESASVLIKSIGWMTYTYPQICWRNNFTNMSVLDYHKLQLSVVPKSLEYSLLLLNENTDFKSTDSVWTINYVGSSIDQNDDIQIIKTPIYSGKPFIELDILYNNQRLEFAFSYNINLTKIYFETLKKHMNDTVQAVSAQLTNKVRVDIGQDRAKSILDRLNNGN